jgi:hypothetical protein
VPPAGHVGEGADDDPEEGAVIVDGGSRRR